MISTSYVHFLKIGFLCYYFVGCFTCATDSQFTGGTRHKFQRWGSIVEEETLLKETKFTGYCWEWNPSLCRLVNGQLMNAGFFQSTPAIAKQTTCFIYLRVLFNALK